MHGSKMGTKTLGSRLAEFGCGLDAKALPATVIEALKLAVLDCLAAALAGVNEPVSRRVVDLVKQDGSSGPATLIGHPVKASMTNAAFANGTTAHACDYDDSSWTMWTHPTAAVLPALLAAAETRNLSGRDVLAALAVGLEIEKAIGIGIQPDHYKTGWHPTGTLGVFGAAAAASRAFGLDRPRFQAALGIAASCSAGIRINVGTMTKPLHVGFAARNGVEAARLAEAGVTSNAAAFEGEDGFFQVYAPKRSEPERAADTLGDPFEVIEPGLVYKLYPCCADLHASVDAILALKEEHGLTPQNVRRIQAGITPLAHNNSPYPAPETPLQAKFSQEYVLAAALVRGRLGLSEFKQPSIDDPAVREVMKRVSVKISPELSGAGSISFSSPAMVDVETTDGRVFHKLVRDLRGSPKNRLTAADLEPKFLQCADVALKPEAARKALQLISDLDSLPNIAPLMSVLSTAKN
ncbi:MAG: MmgE/PrpD family protein [Rhodospirillales bacterium]|nr:MmgE/PrpD family protein [Rhodospirillales bacterium]